MKLFDFVVLSLLLFTLADSAHATQTKKRATRAVVLTTDIGAEMDDQWTLAHLAVAPEIDLRGVVTTHAPSLSAPAAETAARVAADVLRRLPDGARVPVVVGSNVPLAGRATARRNAGVDFLLEQSRDFSTRRRLGVLVTGAATDVASALLIDPTFAHRIEILAMGFENLKDGGDSWNVKNDIAAWQILLAADVPIVIGDAHVTKRDLKMTRQKSRRLFAANGATGDYLSALLEGWLDRDPAFAKQVTGQADTWVIWDEVVTAHLLGMTRVMTYPRPALRDDMSFNFASANLRRRTITGVTDINAERLWRHFTAHLERPPTLN